MIKKKPLQALYGGTFDPVHYGHLKPIETLKDLIGLQYVIIMPNNKPSYRLNLETNNEQRKKMLELAIFNKPLFKLDDYELYCDNFSYTSKVVQNWRDRHGLSQSLIFIIGQDSLLTFPSWNQYKTILNNSHLVVCRRPGYSFNIKKMFQCHMWLKNHLTYNINDLYNFPSGKIYFAKTPQLNISATLIRQRIQQGLSCNGMLPPHVLRYILYNKLYQGIKKY